MPRNAPWFGKVALLDKLWPRHHLRVYFEVFGEVVVKAAFRSIPDKGKRTSGSCEMRPAREKWLPEWEGTPWDGQARAASPSLSPSLLLLLEALGFFLSLWG